MGITQVIRNSGGFSFIIILLFRLHFCQVVPEDKTINTYERTLMQKYKTSYYLQALIVNETVRADFARFVNSHLDEETKSDLKALRVFKKVGKGGPGAEVPVVYFSSAMDTWLGVLPQWKRLKKFLFTQIELYLDTHPELISARNNRK